MAQRQVLGWGTQDTPAEHTISGQQTYELVEIEATFDGSGAAGSFVPAAQIVSDAGVAVGTFPLAGALSAGDSAKVTFAPFLRNDVGLTGVYYDFDNQGDWLEINASGRVPSSSDSVQIFADNGVQIQTFDKLRTFSSGETIFSDGTGGSILLNGGDVELDPASNHNVHIGLSTGSTVTVFDPSSNPIFRIDPDGSLHGKTGKSLVFDL